jgi:hypothetical protein
MPDQDLDQLLRENLGTMFNIGISLGRLERNTLGCFFCGQGEDTRKLEMTIDCMSTRFTRTAHVCRLHDPLTRGSFKNPGIMLGTTFNFQVKFWGEHGPDLVEGGE